MTMGTRYAFGFVRLCSSILRVLLSLRDEAERERNDDVLAALVMMRERGAEEYGRLVSQTIVADVHRSITGQVVPPESVAAYVAAAQDRRSSRARLVNPFAIMSRAVNLARKELERES